MSEAKHDPAEYRRGTIRFSLPRCAESLVRLRPKQRRAEATFSGPGRLKTETPACGRDRLGWFKYIRFLVSESRPYTRTTADSGMLRLISTKCSASEAVGESSTRRSKHSIDTWTAGSNCARSRDYAPTFFLVSAEVLLSLLTQRQANAFRVGVFRVV